MSIVHQIIASLGEREDTESYVIENNGNPSGVFIIDAVAGISATDTLTVTIDGFDPASKKWYNILTTAELEAVATTIIRVGDYSPAVENLAVADFLPKKYRVVATKNTTEPISYSIGANLVG